MSGSTTTPAERISKSDLAKAITASVKPANSHLLVWEASRNEGIDPDAIDAAMDAVIAGAKDIKKLTQAWRAQPATERKPSRRARLEALIFELLARQDGTLSLAQAREKAEKQLKAEDAARARP